MDSLLRAPINQGLIVEAQAEIRHLFRKVGMAAVLFLLLLRGVNFISTLPYVPSLLDTTYALDVIQAYGAAHCESARVKSDLPRNHSSDCCALCMSAAREAAFLVATILTTVHALALEGKPLAPSQYERISLPKPPGLIANWSATSPPQG
jgi:hypothetical protein